MLFCCLSECTHPAVRLPEKYGRLGIQLCEGCLMLLEFRVESSKSEVAGGLDMEQVIILREAQSLLYDKTPRLVGLPGGKSAD